MNTIDFLLSLKDTNEYFETIHSDLEMLIECFSPEMFDYNFLESPFWGETFLKELEQDLETISLEKVKILADIILEYKDFNNKNWPLLDTLRKGIKNYIVKHPKDLDINIYYPILVSGIAKELEEDLKYKVNLSFRDFEKYSKAKVGEDFNHNHDLEFQTPSKYADSSYAIYDIYMTLYHEEYHMLVDEMSINPYCYKTDILKYRIVKSIRLGLREDLAKDFYQLHYVNNQEEMNANLYGLAKAKEKILKLNPNFKVSYVYENIEKPIYDSGSVNNILSTFAKETRDDYHEDLLDKVALKNPQIISGILKRMYNDDGTRKDYYTLKNDFDNAIKNDPNNEDIYEFYAYLIARYIRKLKEEDITNMIRDIDDYELIVKALERYENMLKRDLDNLNSTKLYYLSGYLKKLTTKRLTVKELEKVNKIKQVIEARKELGYGR